MPSAGSVRMTRLRRLFWSCAALGVLVGFLWTPDLAAQQSVSVYVGGFVPRGFDSRDNNDVLVNNLDNGDFSLLFRVRDFRGATIGAEYLVGLGEFFDAGLGAG